MINKMSNTTINIARNQVHAATTAKGILASTQSVANYQRVWSRDAVISGIAGLVAGDEKIIAGLKASLISLGDTQNEQGHIPSNIQFDKNGAVSKISFGGLCGRVDANTWWVIGIGLFSKSQNYPGFIKNYENQIERCLRLLQAWEFNNKGLIYVPQSGNWADEYILQGYTLYDQLLHYWALNLAGELLNRPDWMAKAERTKKLIQENFWVEGNADNAYHPNAFNRKLKSTGPSKYWEACLSPGGYIEKFDLLGNSLAIILGISSKEQSQSVFKYAADLSIYKDQQLFPSFSPVIQKEDPEWFLLASNFAYEFRNHPYQFQNAGIWPAFNAWFGVAQYLSGEEQATKELFEQLVKANQKEDWGFYECLDGKTGKTHGTKYCTWSAAGLLLLGSIIDAKDFDWI